jgi:hypothetical protein
VFCFSGIQNPERSSLREKILAMGGEYRPHWIPGECTHLLCRVSDTPKYQQALGTSLSSDQNENRLLLLRVILLKSVNK